MNEMLIGATFGIAFAICLVVYLFLVTFLPPQGIDKDLIFVILDYMRWISAVSAGGIAGVLSGFLYVTIRKGNSKKGGYLIRAGGGLAVFLLVFFWNPSATVEGRLKGLQEGARLSDLLNACRNLTPWDPTSAAPGVCLDGAKTMCRQLLQEFGHHWAAHEQWAKYTGWFEMQWEDADVHYRQALQLLTQTTTDETALRARPPDKDRLMYVKICRNIGLSKFGSIRSNRSEDFDNPIKYLERAREVCEAIKSQDPGLDWGIRYDIMLVRHLRWDRRAAPETELWSRVKTGWEQLLAASARSQCWVKYHEAGLYATRLGQVADAEGKQKLMRELDAALEEVLNLSIRSESAPIDRNAIKDYLTGRVGPSGYRPRPNDPLVIDALIQYVTNSDSILSRVKGL